MNAIGDAKTLKEVAREWGAFPITVAQEAIEFLRLLYAKTRGLVIVDFLDTSNWDCFESFSYDEERQLLHIHWHNFIKQDKDPPTQHREITSMVFPASLYSLALRFQSIDLIEAETVCLFALKGYSLTDKEIRTALKHGSEEYIQEDDRPFSKKVIRKIDGRWEIVNCIHAALYTVLFVPKKMHFRTDASKLLLYYKNFELLYATLKRCETDLARLDASHSDGICEKVSTIRRTMETLLKIECCYREFSFKKDYAKMRLGDLWGVLKPYHSEEISLLMAKFIEYVNEFSHDTGTPVEKQKADFTLIIARLYLDLFKQEVHRDFRYPRFGHTEENSIAF